MRWKLIGLLLWKWKIQLDNMQTYLVNENQQQELTFIFDDESVLPSDIELHFNLEAYATLIVYIIIVDVSARVKIKCTMQGQGAHAKIYGAYTAAGANAIAIETMLHHQSAYTSSSLIVKGVVRDRAQAHYYGTIRIEKEAHEAHASQQNKNIVLSNAARVVSIPNLEVLTNNVKCFHGSAIGKFDQDQLLYAASRGIDEKVAEVLLLQAFFADVVQDNDMKKRLCDE